MKTENIAPIFKTNLDTKSDKYQQNKKMMLEKLDFLNELLDFAELGGGMHKIMHTPSATIAPRTA